MRHAGKALSSLAVALAVLGASKVNLAGDGGEARMNSARIVTTSAGTSGSHLSQYRFPFGSPVVRRSPSASAPRRLFVLGAYPSAVHVRWTPPVAGKAVPAIPVDNEPEPFWDGTNEADVVAEWRRKVQFNDKLWGTVELAGKLNGSSGVSLSREPLGTLGAL